MLFNSSDPLFCSSDPNTVSESICGDSSRRNACRTSSTTQTNAVRFLQNQVPTYRQIKINRPVYGRTPRDRRGRLVDARSGLTAAYLATATSMTTKMTMKSSCSSSRSIRVRRWRPLKRSLRVRARLTTCGLNSQTGIQVSM
jgi:hypothetical protein